MTSARVLPLLAPATAPRSLDVSRMVVVDGAGSRVFPARAFSTLLERGDVVVVNDAATLPAAIPVRDARGRAFELRLAGPPDEHAEATAVLLGVGDHRTRTEHRAAPPAVRVGDVLEAGVLRIVVLDVLPASPRLVRVSLDRADLLHRVGRPIQYAHVREPVALWDVQNAYASVPWAVEMPSAGRILDARAVSALRARGVGVVPLTHAAGLSDTGDPRIDAQLPMPERYAMPEQTAESVREARARGSRVVAVGTSVVRALEHADLSDAPRGTATLKLGPSTSLRIVTSVVTGLHEPGSTHHELLRAFAPADLLHEALVVAREARLLGHEQGDFLFVDRHGRDARPA